MATQSNQDLKAAQSSLQSSMASESAAWSGFYPQINGSISTAQTNTSASSATSPSNVVTAGLTASENLFAGFQDEAKIEIAKANLEIAQINLRSAKAKLSADLKIAFASLLYAQDSKILSEKILARRQSNLRQVELRYQGGRENKGSILLSQAYLEQAKYEVLIAQQTLESYQIQLARVINMDINTPLNTDKFDSLVVVGSIANPLPTALPNTSGKPEIVNFENPDLNSIAANTPEVLLATTQEQRSLAAVKSARAAFWPALSLNASTSNSGNSWFPATNQWSVGASLSYSFSAGGRDYFGTQAAKEDLRASLYNKGSVKYQVLLKIKQASASLIQALQKLMVDKSFQEAAALREKIAREKYNNGILSFDEWDLIENDSINRQKVYLVSLRERILAQAAWEQVQGKGIIP